MTYKEKIYDKSIVAGFILSSELVLEKESAEQIVSEIVLDILEQIEDCKFSQLGELIEKLKEDHK